MPREEWRSRLGVAAHAAAEVAGALVAVGELAEIAPVAPGSAGGSGGHQARGAFVKLPTHGPRLSAEQERAVAELLDRFRAAPFAPPTRPEVERSIGPELTAALVERGTLVKLGETVLLERAAYDEAVRHIVGYLRAQGTLTVAETRDLLGTSRKYILPLFEQLDERRITLRRGDDRILGPNAPSASA
jgi:selenocysteine-specific elongation factor